MRIHLYIHVKYYHYHCSIYDGGFVGQEQVQEQQRKRSNATGQYSTKQVRFETREMQAESFIDTAIMILQQLLHSSLLQQYLWKGCAYEPLTKRECDVHMNEHVGKRDTCIIWQIINNSNLFVCACVNTGDPTPQAFKNCTPWQSNYSPLVKGKNL